MEISQAHILVVDDEKFNLDIIAEYLSVDYKISTAEDGDIAWAMLEQDPAIFDVIILDRMMPNMNGMELLEKIKQHSTLQYCPVIFQTAKAAEADIAEGLKAGAFYYLTKPFEEDVLLSVVKTAVTDRLHFKEIHNKLESTKLTMGMLNTAKFDFKTLEDARSIASLLSNACPEPESIVMGLTELMINAIEHGNLGITYDEKSKLNEEGNWVKEVNSRLALDNNKDKVATVCFERDSKKIDITIIDQGGGFDNMAYMDFDPNRVMDNHGRGIAIANNLSFSSVEYKGNGNEVLAQLLLFTK